jgi:hypothetical protein
MRKSFVIAENFYADLDAVRQHALAAEWYAPYGDPGERVSWQSTMFRSAQDCPFKSSAALIDTLQALTGDQVDMDDWKADFPVDESGAAVVPPGEVPAGTLWNCAFHFKPEWNRQVVGQGVHNHVTDVWNGVGIDGWAGLVYLDPDPPVEGGLRMWRNRDPARNFDWMTPKENWKLVDTLGNVPNRLLLHRGSLPHSGSAGWGTTPATGRLYQTFFFKVVPPRHPQSLMIV